MDDDVASESGGSRWDHALAGLAAGLVMSALIGTAGSGVMNEDGKAPWVALALLVIATIGTFQMFAVTERWWEAMGVAAVSAGLAAVVIGQPLVSEPNPVHSVPRDAEDPNSEMLLRGIDAALVGEGAPSLWRVFAALVCTAAVPTLIVAGGRWAVSRARFGLTTSSARWRLTTGAGLGLLVAGAVSAVALSLSRPLDDWTERRIAQHAAELTVPDTPEVDPQLVESNGQGWTRQQMVRAVPAGEVIVGVEVPETEDAAGDADTTPAPSAVVGIRAEDGAELWRYTVKSEGQPWIDAVVVDPQARVSLVVIGKALVGLDLDGGISYSRTINPDKDHRGWALPQATSLNSPRNFMAEASVAVLTDQGTLQPGGLEQEITGFDVATGERLWSEAVTSRCHTTAATPPVQTMASANRSTVTLRTGDPRDGCGTMTRYDGAERRWQTALETPPEVASDPRVGVGTEEAWALHLSETDQVVVTTQWFGEVGGGTHSQLTLIEADGTSSAFGGDIAETFEPSYVFGPTVAVDSASGDTIAAVPIVERDNDDSRRDWAGWILFDPDGTVHDRVPISQPPTGRYVRDGFGEVGPYLYEDWTPGDITAEGRHDEIVLRERTEDLRAVARFPYTADCSLPPIGEQLSGDDHTLLIACNGTDSGDVHTTAYPMPT